MIMDMYHVLHTNMRSHLGYWYYLQQKAMIILNYKSGDFQKLHLLHFTAPNSGARGIATYAADMKGLGLIVSAIKFSQVHVHNHRHSQSRNI